MKSVVICGSKRFKPEIRKFAEDLEKVGVVVFSPHLHSRAAEWEQISDDYRKYIALGLTHDHFYKIRMADVVFVYNKDGYCGNSTTLEIGFAVALGKPIYALSNEDEELTRTVIYSGFAETPDELIKKLV